jgi:GT2 family glycosyltransferase
LNLGFEAHPEGGVFYFEFEIWLLEIHAMDLSIIIVTYNSSAYIQACLRSIVEQMREVDHEVIIVDNASSDETIRMIEQEFPRVTLIPNPLNLGFAGANNLGLQRARGEFVLLINPDTRWKRGDIKKAIHLLEGHPEIGALGGRLTLEDGSWQKSHGNFPTLGRELKEVFYLPRLFPQWRCCKGMFTYRERDGKGPVDWVAGAFCLCRKDVVVEMGGFDERYFLYYEDIDLSNGIRGKGREILYYPAIEIIHYQRTPPIYDFGESPYRYFDKHFGPSYAEALRYVLLLKMIVRMMIFFPLTLLAGKEGFREKLKTNYRTFKYHLFEAPKVLKKIKHDSTR